MEDHTLEHRDIGKSNIKLKMRNRQEGKWYLQFLALIIVQAPSLEQLKRVMTAWIFLRDKLGSQRRKTTPRMGRMGAWAGANYHIPPAIYGVWHGCTIVFALQMLLSLFCEGTFYVCSCPCSLENSLFKSVIKKQSWVYFKNTYIAPLFSLVRLRMTVSHQLLTLSIVDLRR